MQTHFQRVQEVKSYFENNDIFLGFRRLLDVATDTQNMDIFQKGIALTHWKESHPEAIDELKSKSIQLLDEIATFDVENHNNDHYILEAQDIVKSYGMAHFALGPISLKIKKGQVYGLVGENGNGKTTLLRILAKEIAENGGNLIYNFQHTPKNEFDLRTKLVYIPQRTKKWHGSLLDNLRFVLANYGIAPEEIETRVLMMVARLGLWKYKDLKWNELSSGYKMRFELARTLLRKPEILLLDEPLANLDVLAQQVILEDLKFMCNAISHPIALILSSQQLYEVEKISDQVIFLKNGKYQDLKQQNVEEELPLIIEIDTNASREALVHCFQSLPLENLQFNGGVYLAKFTHTTTMPQVLMALGTNQLSVVYLRDISTSTRRFFLN